MVTIAQFRGRIVSPALIAAALPPGLPTTASENESPGDGLWFYADARAYLNEALPALESRIPEHKRLQSDWQRRGPVCSAAQNRGESRRPVAEGGPI